MTIRKKADMSASLPPHALQEMTVLFTDVVASTLYFKNYGDMAGRKMLQRHQDMASAPVIEHSGVVVKTLGDSVMAYFADPQEAVRASVRIQQEFARFNRNREPAHQIHIRIGMHLGEGIVEERDIFGNVVNITAKLLPLVGADEICISSQLHERVRNLAPLVFEAADLKGGSREVRKMSVFRVVWGKDVTFDPTTSFLLLLRRLPRKGPDRKGGLWSSIQRMQNKLGPEPPQKVEVQSDGSLAFVFKTIQAAVNAALTLAAIIEQRIGPDHRFRPVPFQILVDTGPFLRANRIMLQELGIDWQTIDPGEINVSIPVCRLIKKDPHYSTYPHFDTGRPDRTYHLFHSERRPRPGTRHFLYHHTMASGSGASCYYCGASSHRAVGCPSKALLDSPLAIRRLAKMAVRDINRLFCNAPPGGPTDADAASSEEAEQQHSAANINLAARAFFELTSVFQLPLFVSLWANPETEWDRIQVGKGGGTKGGQAWLGLDRLRFGDPEQARTLLNAATRETPDDYQSYCALGFLSAEQGAFSNAQLSFNEAVEKTATGPQRIYLYFQRYRLYFLQERLVDADRMLSEIRRIYRRCPEADYCSVQVAFRKGRYKDALDAAEALIDRDPLYYVRFLIDPVFEPHRHHLQPRLASLFRKRETYARRLIPKAEEALKRLSALTGDGEVVLRNAQIAWERIIALAEQGSYGGYLEISRNANEILSAGQRYIEGKKRGVRRNLFDIKKRCERHLENLVPSTYVFLTKSLVADLSALLDETDRLAPAAESKDAALLTAAEERLGQMKVEVQKIDARVQRLDTAGELLDFGFLFLKKSVIIQAINAIVALLLLPLVAYYISLVVPRLAGLQREIWEYQLWFLLLGGGFGIALALRMTATRQKQKKKTSVRSRRR